MSALITIVIQRLVMDRLAMYDTLVRNDIPVLPHYVVDHVHGREEDFEEHEDYVVIKGVKLSKPFVEKPVCLLCS